MKGSKKKEFSNLDSNFDVKEMSKNEVRKGNINEHFILQYVPSLCKVIQINTTERSRYWLCRQGSERSAPVQSVIFVRLKIDPNVPLGHMNWVPRPVFRGQYDPRGQGTGDVQPAVLYGQYEPAGQFLHFVCPYWSWYVPAAHGIIWERTGTDRMGTDRVSMDSTSIESMNTDEG